MSSSSVTHGTRKPVKSQRRRGICSEPTARHGRETLKTGLSPNAGSRVSRQSQPRRNPSPAATRGVGADTEAPSEAPAGSEGVEGRRQSDVREVVARASKEEHTDPGREP